MLALRSFARALPRATFKAAPIRAAQRQIISRSSVLSRITPHKAFSTTRVWQEAAGDSDAELSAKLEHERVLEVKERDPNVFPQDLEDFLADTNFKVQDQPGTENIVLTKQFGNETIKIECSIADMNAERDDLEFDEDSALEDEDFGSDLTSGGKKTINQSGARGGAVDVAPEDSIAPADRDATEEPSEMTAFPLGLRITIEKPAIGATQIIASAQDGEIEIENVHYYPRADLADSQTFEADKEAMNVYGGPPFRHLDAELQQMYETYISERGINTQLAWFLTKYVEYKEQREYVLWLGNLKKFVDV